MNSLNVTNPWYKEGLRFRCTECGKCCSGFPGFVWIDKKDISKLAKHLNLSEEEFIKKFTRQAHGKISLIEKKNYDCIFYKEKKCTVYEARPKQCQTFPFWASNLHSEKDWIEAGKTCEGIDHEDAPLISLENIKKRLS